MSYDSMSLLSGDLNLSIGVKHELTYLNTVIGRIVNVLMKLNFVVKKLFFPNKAYYNPYFMPYA